MVLLYVLRPPQVRFQKRVTLVICRALSLHCRPSPPLAVISMCFVQLPVLNTRHSETEMIRYLYVLERMFTVDVFVLVQW